MKKIKFAVIGTGYIADYHVRGILASDHAEVKAVVSRDPEKARAFADRYQIEASFDSISAVTEHPDIDAAVICTPNAFHAPYAIELLKNGKDVLIDKPLAMNAAEGVRIGEVAKKYGGLVMTGHMWRFDTDTDYIKGEIRSGRLGKIFKTRGYGIHQNWGPSGWFTKKELAGGGALADMGVHAIDTVRYLLGDPLPVSVYARISTHFGDYDVDDTGILLITWDDGTESIIESGWWQPHMDGPEASTGLYGTKGYASLFPTFLKITKGTESFEKIVPDLPARKEHCDQIIYTRQIAHFIECVQNRSQPSPGIEEGLTVLRIVDAAYESARLDQVVHF